MNKNEPDNEELINNLCDHYGIEDDDTYVDEEDYALEVETDMSLQSLCKSLKRLFFSFCYCFLQKKKNIFKTIKFIIAQIWFKVKLYLYKICVDIYVYMC